ncbi:MAG: branched-chain amino acid ABC transporter permease [Alphaproteobacteria bacterium]|nr:branched-chain amino acid ABC transporter permease [Alphaproteobacteria bacterium]
MGAVPPRSAVPARRLQPAEPRTPEARDALWFRLRPRHRRPRGRARPVIPSLAATTRSCRRPDRMRLSRSLSAKTHSRRDRRCRDHRALHRPRADSELFRREGSVRPLPRRPAPRARLRRRDAPGGRAGTPQRDRRHQGRRQRSDIWRALDAVREDEDVASALGIDVVYVRLIAFATGAMLAGFAGGLYGHYMVFVAPDHFSILISVFVVLYVILGGVNNMWGPVVGALLMTLIPEFVRDLAEWRTAFFSLLLVLLLLVRPDGLLTFRTRTVRKP